MSLTFYRVIAVAKSQIEGMEIIWLRCSFLFRIRNLFSPRFYFLFLRFCVRKVEGVKWPPPTLLGTIQVSLPRECFDSRRRRRSFQHRRRRTCILFRALRRRMQPVRHYREFSYASSIFFEKNYFVDDVLDSPDERSYEKFDFGTRWFFFFLVLPGHLSRGVSLKDRRFFFFCCGRLTCFACPHPIP